MQVDFYGLLCSYLQMVSIILAMTVYFMFTMLLNMPDSLNNTWLDIHTFCLLV